MNKHRLAFSVVLLAGLIIGLGGIVAFSKREAFFPKESFGEAQAKIAKPEEVASYHVKYSASQRTNVPDLGIDSMTTLEGNYSLPDRAHITVSRDGFRQEQVVVGDSVFTRTELNPDWVRTQVPSGDEMTPLPKPKTGQEEMGYLDDVKTLPDETMDGVPVNHYVGKVNYEKVLVEDARQRFVNDPDLDSYVERAREVAGRINATNELWIGKDDGLVRQARITGEYRPSPSEMGSFSGGLGVEEVVVNFDTWLEFSRFNESFAIEVPATSAHPSGL